MKKIIVILMAMSFCLFAVAQDKSYTFPNSRTYVDMSGFGTSDTIVASDTYSIVFTVNQHYPNTQSVYVDIDSVSGTPTMNIIMQGRIFAGGTWVAIDTTAWAGTGDTTFTMTNATAARYRYYRLYFKSDATAQKAKVIDVQFKLWRE